MRVGGDTSGQCQHLFTEDNEAIEGKYGDGRLAPGAETLCGEEYPRGAGTYRVSSYASLRSMDGLEGYLEAEAESLCPECLEVAVRFHGWPEPPEAPA
jgi:hypothetical protein